MPTTGGWRQPPPLPRILRFGDCITRGEIFPALISTDLRRFRALLTTLTLHNTKLAMSKKSLLACLRRLHASRDQAHR